MAKLSALVLTFSLLLTACGSSPPPSNPAPDDASRIVLSRINSLTDCNALQREFDIADSNNRVDYMKAADARMSAVGCY